MKRFLSFGAIFLLIASTVFPQRVMLHKVIENSTTTNIYGISQDKQGYIWLATEKGLMRYDGTEIKSYLNDPLDSNSMSSNAAQHLCVDSNSIIWVATYGKGLNSYDPLTNTFTHYRHRQNDLSSIITDSIFWLLADHANNLWVGTNRGLDLLDRKTGKFIHYFSKTNDTTFVSSNFVGALYEDRKGVLWVSIVDSFSHVGGAFPEKGFLSRFDRATGKFISYVHDPADPGSIGPGLIRGFFEDSEGNFWIGTMNDGLQQMDRERGRFIHYYYDPSHPEKPSRPPLCKTCPYDPISFITKDVAGGLWIGTINNGINRYDPVLKKNTHYGSITKSLNPNSIVMDTSGGGFNDKFPSVAFSSKDGLLWIASFTGALYNANLLKASIPFYKILHNLDGNTFYTQKGNNILWIGTDSGLIRVNRTNGDIKVFAHDAKNANSLCNDTIGTMRIDSDGKFWMTTNNGLSKFDPLTNNFTTYLHNEKKPGSLSSNNLMNLCIDHDKNIWVATSNTGMDKMNVNTGTFTHYSHDNKDTASLGNNNVYCIAEDHDNTIWAGTDLGLNRLDNTTGKFHHYLKTFSIRSIYVDHAGVVWVGTMDRLFRFDRAKHQFVAYSDPALRTDIKEIMHIMEDNQNNLWVSTASAFIKINEQRNEVRIYGDSYGVHKSNFLFADNFKGENGELFFGDQTGYYSFFPESLKGKDVPLQVNLMSFSLGDEEVKPGQENVLTVPLWQAEEIKLSYSQNIFSFDFEAISFTSPGEKNYLFMLENYDNTWHFLGADHKAYFFNVPPGTYIFHAKAVAPDGIWGEKTIRIIITPPWWRTWWAYTIFSLTFIGIVWAFIRYRSERLRRENKILEEKVAHRTAQLNQSLDNLKATQSQLIQSEKMASLGELTAGIAHEIQNPLNFVNNFSEVSNELIEELNEELEKGDVEEAKAISNDIKANLEKINHHGKRADGIVKGMLQHSRTTSGQKELTNINTLCDEYLRLSYHGLRAKDKSFNAAYETNFDDSIGKINIVPQDIGRVLLNLINNAFYAAPLPPEGGFKDPEYRHTPTVWVSTKKQGDKILISVRDNGPGIPDSIKEKIFQPFFTTKPTGQGTGLGLSLSYDIVKAHGGELKVDTRKDEFTCFTVTLPN